MVVANLAMFVVEIALASKAGSVSLTADSVDFLEDASLGILALIGPILHPRVRSRFGMAAALILLAPTAAALFAAWRRLHAHAPPQATIITLTAVAALGVNLLCAGLLGRLGTTGDSTLRAAFLSARNDVLANLATLAVGAVVAWTRSGWPDIVVGLCIAALNGDAAWEVWQTAREERAAST